MAQESVRTPSSRTYKQLGNLSPTFPEARAIQLTSSRSLPPVAASPSSELTAPNTGYRFVHRKPKAKRNRKGSGPYKSVLKERSVEFNLTLDVQTLRQQIQQLTTTRDLLQSRKLQFRHSPTGSLMQVVREFFQLFREGFRVEQHTSRRRVITAGVQRDFLYSVVDEQIDFGNGLGGIAFMVEMIRRYSLLLRFICMKMDSFTITLTDDDQGVMVKARGTLRFQVLRETVAALFPHILGNTWLCGRLIGAEVEAPTMLTIRFNAKDKMCAYEPEADYVVAFTQVLRDPQHVLELMGQSKIGDKSMFGVDDDGHVEDVVRAIAEPEAEQSATPLAYQQGPSTAKSRVTDDEHVNYRPTVRDSARGTQQRSLGDESIQALPPPAYRSAIGRYLLTFANGWPPEYDVRAASSSPQRRFLQHFVSPHVVVGRHVGHEAIERFWKMLGESFEEVKFRGASEPRLYTDESEVVSVHIRATYVLLTDISTLQTVFPHVLRHPELVQALLGVTITCPSVLWFEWHDGHARVARIHEQLDWDAALTPLFATSDDRAFVLGAARLPSWA